MSYLKRRTVGTVPTRRIVIVSGNNQAATVNAALAAPLVVKVTDVTGSPVQNATILWTASAGTVSAATSTTDSTGQTSITYTNPTGAGTPTVQATVLSVAGVVATFSVTTNAPATPTMTINGGNGQSAAVSTAVATVPSVLLLNNLGQPAVGVVVQWAASGSGTVGTPNATTNASGVATCGSWTLSASPGANTLTVTATGYTGSPQTFTATGTGSPTIALYVGNNQSVPVSTAVPIKPAVVLTSAGGSPVVGATVTFAVASGGGAVTGASAVTDVNGIATVGSWTVGSTAGTNTLTATCVGYTGSPVTFTAAGGSAEPTPAGGTILFDMRAGGNRDLQAVNNFTQANALFQNGGGGLYNGNGTWGLSTNYNGASKNAIRVDWPANPGTESTATGYIYHATVQNLYCSVVWHLGNTPTGGGVGAVGAYQPSSATQKEKRLLFLRQADNGAGRLYWQWDFGTDGHGVWCIDSDNFRKDGNAADQGVGQDVRWTFVMRPLDGVLQVWRNGVLLDSYSGGGFETLGFAETQWIATRYNVTQPETEFWTDFVLWSQP